MNTLGKLTHISNHHLSKEYTCPYCHCDVIPAAIESERVSAYFRAKKHHDDKCPFKYIESKDSYDNQNSNVEEIYQRMLRQGFKKVETARESSDERTKSSKISRINNLKSLVSFCLDSSIDDSVGHNTIKDFFVDERTHTIHQQFSPGKLYLVRCYFRRYDDIRRHIVLRYPRRIAEDAKREITLKFATAQETGLYKEVKDRIFSTKEEHSIYPDLYIIGKLNKSKQMIIQNIHQILFLKRL